MMMPVGMAGGIPSARTAGIAANALRADALRWHVTSTRSLGCHMPRTAGCPRIASTARIASIGMERALCVATTARSTGGRATDSRDTTNEQAAAGTGGGLRRQEAGWGMLQHRSDLSAPVVAPRPL